MATLENQKNNNLETREAPVISLKNQEQKEISLEEFSDFANEEEQNFKQETTVEIGKLNSVDIDQPTFENLKNETGVENDLNTVDKEVETVVLEAKSKVTNLKEGQENNQKTGEVLSGTTSVEKVAIYSDPEDDLLISGMDKKIREMVARQIDPSGDYKDVPPALVHAKLAFYANFLRENPDKAQAYLTYGNEKYKDSDLVPSWYNGIREATQKKEDNEKYNNIVNNFDLKNGSKVMIDNQEYTLFLENANSIALVSKNKFLYGNYHKRDFKDHSLGNSSYEDLEKILTSSENNKTEKKHNIKEDPFSKELLEEEVNFENSEYPNTMKEMYSAGENVLSNIESTEKEKEFAQKFLHQLQQENIQSVEEINQYMEYIDKELTERFKEILKNGVLLNEQREKLNINESNEKYFDVKVLSLEEDFAGDDSEWKKITGCPSMFVRRGKIKGEKIIPTIFISKNMLTELDVDSTKIEKDSSEFYDFQAHKKILQHEYRHTQRKFSSENDKLFRLLDEACTNVGSLYGKLQGLLDCIGMTTNDFDLQKIKEAYSSDDDTSKALILNKIKNNFGDLGLMLIGSKSSSEHTNDYEGIKEIPLIEVDESGLKDKNHDYTDSKFLETLLSLRNKHDENWYNLLKNNLKDEKISLVYLEDVLQNYYLMSYKKLKDNPDCPNLKIFFNILSSEIERRKSSLI